MFKNVAGQKITLLAIDTSTNSPKTGDAANITAYVSKDDGAVTVLGDTTATELDATNAPGLYSFDLTQAETNADKELFSGKSSTANIKIIPVLLYTVPANFTATSIDSNGRLDVIKINGTSQTARDLGAQLDATISSRMASFTVPTNFSSLAITAGGEVTIGTNNDKTGYSLTQSFPSNFAALGISAGGHISNVDTLTTYTGDTPQTGDTYALANGASGFAAIKTDTGNLVTRITSTLFSGITSLAQWLGLIVGKQVGDATARTEIRNTGAGSGTYDETTDSQEALADKGNDVACSGTVNDAAPTAGSFNVSIIGIASPVLTNQCLLFRTGAIAGESKPITNIVGTLYSFDEPFSQAPSNGDQFDIGLLHVHPVSEIAAAVRDVNNQMPAANSLGEVANAIKTKTDLLPELPAKNASFTYVIKMVQSSDHVTPATGLTVTMTVSLDGAAFGAAAGTVTEISSGHYKVVAAAADMNGNTVTHRFTGTAADDLSVEFVTTS